MNTSVRGSRIEQTNFGHEGWPFFAGRDLLYLFVIRVTNIAHRASVFCCISSFHELNALSILREILLFKSILSI